jgi:predicted DsbA family dithiol-disulfide isomerase
MTLILTLILDLLDLDVDRFQKCLDSQKYEKRVQEDVVEGGQIGITGTPANIFYIVRPARL